MRRPRLALARAHCARHVPRAFRRIGSQLVRLSSRVPSCGYLRSGAWGVYRRDTTDRNGRARVVRRVFEGFPGPVRVWWRSGPHPQGLLYSGEKTTQGARRASSRATLVIAPPTLAHGPNACALCLAEHQQSAARPHPARQSCWWLVVPPHPCPLWALHWWPPPLGLNPALPHLAGLLRLS